MNQRSKDSFAVLMVCALLACVGPLACGGGSGSPQPSAPPPPGAPGATTFRGNLAGMTAQREPEPSGLPAFALRMPLSLASRVEAQENGVQVCVDGTTFCSLTDANGAFVISAPVSGNVVLLFTGVDFTARLAITGVPPGAVVRIRNIECSTSSGRCVPQQLDVEAPTPSPLPPANQAPICALAAANPAVLFPPNHQMVAILIAGVSDPDGDALTITATSVLQDEPVLGTGSGDTAPDATLDPLAVRAERSGQGNGRVYTVDFVADDGHGASCTGRVQICVPHDQRPGATCIDDGAAFDSTE